MLESFPNATLVQFLANASGDLKIQNETTTTTTTTIQKKMLSPRGIPKIGGYTQKYHGLESTPRAAGASLGNHTETRI